MCIIKIHYKIPQNFISGIFVLSRVTRLRYWQLTPDELTKATYDENKVLVWEIKCTKKEAEFFAVFCYKNGIPLGYTTVDGIAYYYNNIPEHELDEITKFLKDKFGGDFKEKDARIFLVGSKEIYSPNDIASLASELESKFQVSVDLSVELQDFTPEEQEQSNLPKTKILPIPGK